MTKERDTQRRKGRSYMPLRPTRRGSQVKRVRIRWRDRQKESGREKERRPINRARGRLVEIQREKQNDSSRETAALRDVERDSKGRGGHREIYRYKTTIRKANS